LPKSFRSAFGPAPDLEVGPVEEPVKLSCLAKAVFLECDIYFSYGVKAGACNPFFQLSWAFLDEVMRSVFLNELVRPGGYADRSDAGC